MGFFSQKTILQGGVSRWTRLVKFWHTIFAMPFALVSYVYALRYTSAGFDWRVLVLMLAAMVFARNAAMGFNRLVDRKIDAENPRTSGREIPSGQVAPRSAAWFVAVNAALFIVAAGLLGRLTLILAPVALFVVLGYSYTKRFTAWSHVILGAGLAMAPVGAYMAVTQGIAMVPMVLAAGVMTWVAGFDILYARADADFDRAHGLHSVPARFSDRTAVIISILLHVVTTYAVVMLGLYMGLGTLYWIGCGIFTALLILQHTDKKLAFDWVNGAASVLYAGFAIADMLV